MVSALVIMMKNRKDMKQSPIWALDKLTGAYHVSLEGYSFGSQSSRLFVDRRKHWSLEI